MHNVTFQNIADAAKKQKDAAYSLFQKKTKALEKIAFMAQQCEDVIANADDAIVAQKSHVIEREMISMHAALQGVDIEPQNADKWLKMAQDAHVQIYIIIG